MALLGRLTYISDNLSSMTILRSFSLSALMLVLLMAGTLSVHAQAPSETMTSAKCVVFSHDLSYGSRDAATGGEVTALQNYLVGAGYLGSGSVTGYFGPLTRAAAVRLQAANGLPAQGFVGPLTRAVMQKFCLGHGVTAPTVSSVTPTSGPVGTQVTITGSNFGATTTVRLGYGGLNNLETMDGGTKVTFTVPTALGPYCETGHPCPYYARLLTPGSYDLWVQNDQGSSATSTFTVTDGSALSLERIDAPSTLKVGETGTWTLTLGQSAGSELSYSILWGDEKNGATTSTTTDAISDPSSTHLTALSHSYAKVGTYQPVFVITDDHGGKLRILSSVKVSI